ncbi:MAG: recombinase family protein [Deferribacteraceae bacterium]|nr:recombinase family protein [Deferribacteraceae bacterium]
MLRNTFYTGVLTHQQTNITGNHEAIISKLQFGKVQKQLERRNKR